MHFVLLKLSAIGDCICTVPLVRALQRAYPNSKISWIISQPAYSLLEGLSGVDFIVVKKPRSVRDYLNFRKLIQPYSFDVLLAVHTSLRANLMLPFIQAARKIGFDYKRAKDGQRLFVRESIAAKPTGHFVDRYLQFAEYLGVRDLTPEWNLTIAPAERAWAVNLLKGSSKWLALNPVASTSQKTWSVQGYAELLQRAHTELNYQIVITGGPGEAEQQFVAAIVQAARVPVLNLSGDQAVNLKQLAALYEKVTVVVAPDTGPMHLADAMGTKVIGLFAVTDPKISGPYHNQRYVINHYKNSMNTIRTDEIIEQLKNVANCIA